MELKPKLQTEIADLSKQASDLHGRILAELHLPTRRRLQEKRAKIIQRVASLKNQAYEQQETVKHAELRALVQEKLPLIVFEVAGRKLQIDPDSLEVEIPMSCGKHTKTVNVLEILNDGSKPDSTKWHRLFTLWTVMFGDGRVYSGKLNCAQCQKAKKQLRAKWGKWNNEPIGHAYWKLRPLQ
jgi:hypothetical protein